jgi:hypothetical protein
MTVKRIFQDALPTITFLAHQPIIAKPLAVLAAPVVNVFDGK